ncbi:MAG: M48 family metallopeptidase [Candidatus Nanosyncoccaceae bacterium]|jgi:predicted metal-dependent hydrolase
MTKSANISNQLVDDEFGSININRRRGGSRISIRLDKFGQLNITAPKWLSKRQIVNFVDERRSVIREIITKQAQKQYIDGQTIGKNHLLKVEPSEKLRASIRPNFLVIHLPKNRQLKEPEVQSLISQNVAKILRQQAKHYLPERLDYLAKKHGFKYEKLRLSHAITRWGSCTNKGTISLNITLMTLPNDAIDYVIVHELCHLRHPNHSKDFWEEVGKIIPNYKYYEKLLKHYSVIV